MTYRRFTCAFEDCGNSDSDSENIYLIFVPLITIINTQKTDQEAPINYVASKGATNMSTIMMATTAVAMLLLTAELGGSL